MADAIGISGIHNVSGKCDLCGRRVDALTEELNALDCTYQDCPPLVYHQDCLEKYLKSIRLEKNRKTGFKCPRGAGKGTAFKEACPGKIDKSHPIHPRNDLGKKRRKAKPPPEPLPRPKPLPKKEKEKVKEKDKEKEAKSDKVKEQKGKQKSSVVIKALNVSHAGLVKNVKPTVSRSVSLSGDALRGQTDSKKPLSSGSGPYSSTTSPGGLESQDNLRTGSMPLFSAWSKPMSTASHSQVPDLNSMTAFPPALVGSTSEENKPLSRPCQNCWANISRAQSGSHSRSMSVNDATLQGGVPQAQSLPNSLSIGSTGELPVGMDYADGMGVEGKLTKAQKKNMKRAERKKKNTGVDAPVSSSPTSSSATPALVTPATQTPGTHTPVEPSDDGSSPLFGSSKNDSSSSQSSVLSGLCVDTIVAWKTMHHIQQLQKLGFEPWQSAAAVWRFGGNLELAIAWLLECNGENGDDGDHLGGYVVPEVDVTSELSYLQEVQDTFSLPENVLEQAVIDCNGDLDLAVPTALGTLDEEAEVTAAAEASASTAKGTPSRAISPDLEVEESPFAGGFPFGQSAMESQPPGSVSVEATPSLETLSPSMDTTTESMWADPLSSDVLLGGVLGSTLEEYKRGNLDFTALASKGFGAGLRTATPTDVNVMGLQGVAARNGNQTSTFELLSQNQALYRNLAPGAIRSTGGSGNIIANVGHYNKVMTAAGTSANPLSGVGCIGGNGAGLTSSWNLGVGSFNGLSHGGQLGIDNLPEEQQDLRHFIGNLLES